MTVAPNSGILACATTSFAAFNRFTPDWIFICMPSTTTIALSTSMPSAIINAPKEIRSSVISYIPITSNVPQIVTNKMAPIIKPDRIRPGDKVGLVNPATAAFEAQPIEIMVEALESLGLDVILSSNYYNRHGYFAGIDAARANDLMEFFRDSSVKMIFARGGWGSARVLPLLDYDTIRRNPKVLLGYSDATALLTGIYAKTGLVTFHGPSPLNKFSAGYFGRVVMNGELVTMINPTDVADDSLVQTENRIQTITGGKANGRILGGNLTVLTAIMGSGYLPNWDDSILFLEDVNEAAYRVDRMLTELSLAGVLGKIKGFVFGRCTECKPDNSYGSLTLE